MSALFLKLINMSISASWVILALMILRLALKKSPKWVPVLLWGIVAIRLICPFTMESAVSLIPDSVGSGELVSEWVDDYIGDIDIYHPDSIRYDAAIGAGREPISDGEGGYYVVTKHDQLGEPATVENTVIPVLSIAWGMGMSLMALYAAISYWSLCRKLNTAVLYRDNIYQSEHISTPFVLGIRKPKIYLPFHMNSQNLEYVIAHEQAHICRKDHWWKPIGFLLLSVHWFNPFVWLAYILLCRDIELACDEKVIKELGIEGRADYSAVLLSCSTKHHAISACPLAFGEVSVRTRIKTVLSYKKPAFWIVVVALLLFCVAVPCFLTDPIGSSGQPDLSFSNYENAAALLIDVPEIQAIYCPPNQEESNSQIQIGVVNGSALTQYLDNCQWTIRKKPSVLLSSPGSVEFIIQDDYRITVYDRKGWQFSGCAEVQHGDAVRYYRIGASDYQTAVALIQSPVKNTDDEKYYLQIGIADVFEIQVKTPMDTQTYRNTLGTAFSVGQKVHLESLDGFSDIKGVSVTAFDEQGEILYLFSVPEEASNSEVINIVAADCWLLAPTAVVEGDVEDGQYYHIINTDGVAELKFSGTNFSGSCVPANSTTFLKGEKVWLESLNDISNPEDMIITALDKNGDILYRIMAVPNSAEKQLSESLGWDGGIGFTDLKPNEEITSAFEIQLDKPVNKLQYVINWSRSGLTLEYGIRSAEGLEYYCAKEGGYDKDQLEGIPAGAYQLFIRNTDYSGVPAFENPDDYSDVSFNATGAMNYRIE